MHSDNHKPDGAWEYWDESIEFIVSFVEKGCDGWRKWRVDDMSLYRGQVWLQVCTQTVYGGLEAEVRYQARKMVHSETGQNLDDVKTILIFRMVRKQNSRTSDR